jgi:hypothetical protein
MKKEEIDMTTVKQRGATSTVTGPNGVYKVRRHPTKRGKWQILQFANNQTRLVMNWNWGRDEAVFKAYSLASDY